MNNDWKDFIGLVRKVDNTRLLEFPIGYRANSSQLRYCRSKSNTMNLLCTGLKDSGKSNFLRNVMATIAFAYEKKNVEFITLVDFNIPREVQDSGVDVTEVYSMSALMSALWGIEHKYKLGCSKDKLVIVFIDDIINNINSMPSGLREGYFEDLVYWLTVGYKFNISFIMTTEVMSSNNNIYKLTTICDKCVYVSKAEKDKGVKYYATLECESRAYNLVIPVYSKAECSSVKDTASMESLLDELSKGRITYNKEIHNYVVATTVAEGDDTTTKRIYGSEKSVLVISAKNKVEARDKFIRLGFPRKILLPENIIEVSVVRKNKR